MNKQEVYEYLNRRGIRYEITEHEAVYNMEEASGLILPHPEAEAKNLFVRDDKKQNYYLITVKGNKRVDLKEFRRKQHTRPLSFASADDLASLLGLIPGAVTPLGLLNDKGRRVQFFPDEAFREAPGLIGVHPNDNTATVFLQSTDLVACLREAGHTVEVCAF